MVTTDRMVWAALAVLWVLMHPFVGVDGDARIYMGRALADIDPGGVGRDMMFVMDGQSNFTIFRLLAGTLAGRIGLGGTVVILSLVNLAAWFAAAVLLVRAIAPGRAAMVLLAALVVLPRFYTPWNLLSAGESIPEPRPLAEAGVLLAMAALVQSRIWLCLAGLTTAALVHPIMAAPGFGVLFVVLAQRDGRWLLGALGLVIVVSIAGLLGLPLASRLTQTMDGAWRAVLIDRNPYLFVTRWPPETLGPIVVRGVTIALACLWLGKTARTIVLASCGVALLGLATSTILGDGFFDTLVVQAQLWRALWLSTVLSNIAAGLCLLNLPRKGAAGQITLCFLALAWIAIDIAQIGPIAALLALEMFFAVPRLSVPISRTVVLAIVGCCTIVGLALLWTSAAAVPVIVASSPDRHAAWSAICAVRLLIVPILLLTMVWWHWPDAAITRGCVGVVLIVGTTILATQWSTRAAAQADVDAATLKTDLATLMARRPGDVLWTEGDEAWMWLHKANWNGQIQGTSIVFSRELALRWRTRAEAVLKAGLATKNLLRPLLDAAPVRSPTLDVTRIKAFCAGVDRPAWIVAPLDREAIIPNGLGATTWSPAFPRGRRVSDGDTLRWLSFDRYAVIPCAGLVRTPSNTERPSNDQG